MVTFFHMEMFFIFQICVVPDGFYEYLQDRVQVGYEDQKGDKEDGKHPDRYDLQYGNSDIGKESGYHKRENDENDGRDESPDVDQKEGKIEMEGNTEVIDRHIDREAQCLERLLMLEYDKEPSIGKEDIHEKRETEIDSHDYAYDYEIVFSEYPKEENIESDDRKELEDGKGIIEFKNREKTHESTRNPIPHTPFGVGRLERTVLPFGDK